MRFYGLCAFWHDDCFTGVEPLGFKNLENKDGFEYMHYKRRVV